jgi:cyclophilin family peptidyl-prolyl cis-trans isomerase
MMRTAFFVLLAGILFLAYGCSTGAPATTSKPAAATTAARTTTAAPAVTTATAPTTAQTGGQMKWSSPPAMAIDVNKDYTATIKTNYGDIVVQLLPKESPKTVNNFVFLARQGYYNGVKFHRVIKGFMIQTGDPTGTGSGSPGYRFADELPVKHSYEPGIVAMANAGPNTNGSQFFICSGAQAKGLDSQPNYTQFGRVISGMEIVSKIENVPVTGREPSQPTIDVHMESVTIEEK